MAICTMKRRGRPTPVVTRFSMAMAERAGLTRTDGPWQTYPERMLRMRARSWTMRDAFPDVLRGLQLREEVEDHAGTRGGAPLRPAQHEATPPGSPSPDASPWPKRPIASNGASRPDDRPTAEAPPPGKRGKDRSTAEPLPTAESYILIDADGVVVEIADRAALRAGFERLVFDKHLSAEQIAGVWEANEPARQTIERSFGRAALTQAQEHLQSLRELRSRPRGDRRPAGIRRSISLGATNAPGRINPQSPIRPWRWRSARPGVSRKSSSTTARRSTRSVTTRRGISRRSPGSVRPTSRWKSASAPSFPAAS